MKNNVGFFNSLAFTSIILFALAFSSVQASTSSVVVNTVQGISKSDDCKDKKEKSGCCNKKKNKSCDDKNTKDKK